MSYPGSIPGDHQSPLWVITGSHSWGGSGKLDTQDKKSPFAEEWIPDGQLATLSLDSSKEETIDLEDHPDEAPGKIEVQQVGPLDPSVPSTCREHGHQLSLFCYQEHKLICDQCKSLGTCQAHRTKPMEERASQIRVSTPALQNCAPLAIQGLKLEHPCVEAGGGECAAAET
ncbi:hypothetical protein GDO81_023257 [Engystomops pustulosus]|uniref:B box-type domain-containing protein n=1 Tax=Engystomops pustulosus TaxID=76066 RepID=A0AAV6YMI7_ENGPU|nr:hypothetical protein GDO81_023259 [Engystomops pustulosus]KAG8538126.1 hypothetical protein GDO81_023257 [Engystomops pustulosus]